MKRILLTFFFLAIYFLINNSQAQTINGSEEKIKALLCRKWKATEMKTSQKTVKMPGNAAVYFNFRKNGTVGLEGGGSGDEEYWTYDHSKKTVTIKENKTVDRKDVFRITAITSKTLVLTTSMDGMSTAMHFVAVN
jgi:hypothetical protein